jgi:uncharacterized RDD family membrane protein YckC
VIDAVILNVASLVLVAITSASLGYGLFTLIGLGYAIFLEGSPSGQTVGKRVMGIRVIDFQAGGPIGYGRALLRYLGRIVSTVACLLGYFWMLWDREKQTWHDKIANSVVVPVSHYPVERWPG